MMLAVSSSKKTIRRNAKMKHMFNVSVGVFGLLLACIVLSPQLHAQTGSISGTAMDSTGAVVQDVEITVRNLGTSETHATKSGANGAYTVTNLPVGNYEINGRQEGFKIFHVPSVTLTVAQALTVNIQLEAGGTSEEVQVMGDALPGVELEDAQVSNVVDTRTMKDLPLITRNPYDLLLLSPGTSTTNALGGYTVNGSRERNNNFLLDGVDNNDTSVPGAAGSIVLSASPESTQEFRVITNNFNAEYGRNTGAIVDVVTKSGTNEFHGDAYEFGRYNGFGGARDWFNPGVGPTAGPMNPYVRNQFGFSVGGRIFKNKTFFFFNDEMQRFRTTLTNSATVPTTEFVNTGVFTTPDVNGTPVTVDLSDPNQQSFPAFFGVAPLPQDPTAHNLLSKYPAPQVLNADGYSGKIFFPSSDAQDSYQTVLKIDHHITDREVLNLRFGYDHFADPNAGHFDILPGNVGAVDEKAISYGLRANLVSTLSSHLVNNFNFGINHIYANFKCGGLNTINSATPQVDQFGRGWDYTVNPFTNFGCTSLAADGQFRTTGTVSYGDDITWVKGAHTFKFGGDFRNIAERGPNSFFSRRQVSMTSGTAGLPVLLTDLGDFGLNLVLNDAASAWYGFVVSDFNGEFFDKNAARQPLDDKHFRQHEYGFFGQDSWKIRHNLTLNLGVRYQLDGVPYEENANFSNLLTNPATFPVTMSLVGPGTGNQLYKQDYSNIEPRFGFAWDPWGTGRTSVRGGFGIFHDRVFGNLFGNARGNPPFEQDYVNQPFDTLAGTGVISDPSIGGGFFALPNVPDTTPSPVIPDGAQLTPILFDTNFRNAASNNWNLGIQHQITHSTVVDVAYVGSKGTHIYRVVDGNPPDPTLVASLLAFCVPSNPANDGFIEGQCSATDVTKANLFNGADNGFLPFNAVAHNALFQPTYNRSVGNSSYNSLQAKITRRFSRSLQVQGSYTWAHAIDDSSDGLVPAFGNRSFPRNSLNLGEERGNSDNDIRHIAVISYIWEVPVGTGRPILNKGVIGKIFEGFQFSGITSAQTGHPFDIFSNTDSERTGVSNRADLVGDPFAGGGGLPSDAADGKVFFTACADTTCSAAFAQPPYGRAGNIGRNHFYGPNFVNFDMSVAKKMKFGERMGLEIRIEGYNVFNHPEFNNPAGTQMNFADFGIITSALVHSDGTTSARQLQAAAKFTF
jgi:outer membrane receptor protein involved in Fe transport